MVVIISIAQVTEGNHKVCSFCTSRIYLALCILVETNFGEVVDDVSLFVPIVVGTRVDGSSGGGESYECYVRVAITDDFVGRKHRFVGTYVAEIGRYYRSIHLVHEVKQLLYSVVELVISKCNHIVAYVIHYVHNAFTLRFNTYKVALYEITTLVLMRIS